VRRHLEIAGLRVAGPGLMWLTQPPSRAGSPKRGPVYEGKRARRDRAQPSMDRTSIPSVAGSCLRAAVGGAFQGGNREAETAADEVEEFKRRYREGGGQAGRAGASGDDREEDGCGSI